MFGRLGDLRARLVRAAYQVLGPARMHRITHVAVRPGGDVLVDSASGVVSRFHVLSYQTGALDRTYWLGRPISKSPLDCWTYQEIIHELRPDLIVETGTYLGGSASFFAAMCDLVGHGEIVTIDDRERVTFTHPRVTALIGDSTSDSILARVAARAARSKRVLVTLDADHRAEHVGRELRAYAPFVTLGSYLVVEDTNVNGHPVFPDHGPGPMEALREFLAETDEFAPDPSREKFLLTYFPGGWLKRVRPAR